MELISIREFARRVGVSDTSINNLRAEGVFPEGITVEPGQRPKVNYEKALQEFEAAGAIRKSKNSKPSDFKVKPTEKKQAVSKSNSKNEAKDPHEIPQRQPFKFDVDIENLTLKELQVRDNESRNEIGRKKELIEAKLKLYELQEREKDLLPKKVVYKILYDIGQSFRTEFQNMPNRIVDTIIAVDSTNVAAARSEVENLLVNEIDTILTRIAELDTIDFGRDTEN